MIINIKNGFYSLLIVQNISLVHQCLNKLLAQLNNTNSYSLSLSSEIRSLVKAKLRLLTTTEYSSGLRNLVLFYINILLEKLIFEVSLACYEIWCYI